MEAKHTPSTIGQAGQLLPDERYCTHCGKPLKARLAWLECDWRTGAYQDGGVPAEFSQGWFPFGLTCARAAIAKATGAGQ